MRKHRIVKIEAGWAVQKRKMIFFWTTIGCHYARSQALVQYIEVEAA